MIPAWLADAADEIWRRFGGEIPFPRDLEPRAPLALPLTLVGLERLSISAVDTWLRRRGGDYRFLCADRALRGCVVASRGIGAVFMDSGDAPDERRYTVAHEIAHFVMDYLHPRQEALSLFGEMIRPALDGDRATSLTERIDARLADVPLGIYVNLLPRTAAGRIESGPVLRAEERADRLALELLAPLEAVQRDLGAFEGESRAFVAAAAEVLRTTFGLPDRVAREYAVWLEGRLSPPSSREWLGL